MISDPCCSSAAAFFCRSIVEVTSLDLGISYSIYSFVFFSLFFLYLSSFAISEKKQTGHSLTPFLNPPRSQVNLESTSLRNLSLYFSSSFLQLSTMDDYYLRGGRVPAFGSWDCNEGLPFTECFERARQAGLLHCNYSEDRDLYVADDLYENDAMILVPRRRVKRGKGGKEAWVVCDGEMGVKEPPSPLTPSPPRRAPKAVDEDLYKISPEFLHVKSTRKGMWGFLSSCLQPSCVR